jgi:hypothetical protein
MLAKQIAAILAIACEVTLMIRSSTSSRLYRAFFGREDDTYCLSYDRNIASCTCHTCRDNYDVMTAECFMIRYQWDTGGREYRYWSYDDGCYP